MRRHLEPTYEALGQRALAAPVIHVDETRWPRLGGEAPAAGTVWNIATPSLAFYPILRGKSAEGRQLLGHYRGTVVVDGYAVDDVLARDGPGFALAHCWAHTKRKYEAIAEHWPTACAEITHRSEATTAVRLVSLLRLESRHLIVFLCSSIKDT